MIHNLQQNPNRRWKSPMSMSNPQILIKFRSEFLSIQQTKKNPLAQKT